MTDILGWVIAGLIMGGIQTIGSYYTNKYLIDHLDRNIEKAKNVGFKEKIGTMLQNYGKKLEELDKKGLEEMKK